MALNPENLQRVQEWLAEKSHSSHMLTIARDGESPVRSIYYYQTVDEAEAAYNRYQDWGFAKDYLTVDLYLISGEKRSKILPRPRGGECVFTRQEYLDTANILAEVKDKVAPEVFYILAGRFSRMFAKDNQRFNPERFFENLGLEKEALNEFD
jgi:hypothetical protein